MDRRASSRRTICDDRTSGIISILYVHIGSKPSGGIHREQINKGIIRGGGKMKGERPISI